MAQFIETNPWDPNFALPDHVRAEPPGRGVVRTKWAPRKTISGVIPYNKQYAIPDYVLAEPPGRGVQYTKGAKRKTIPTLVPAYLGGDHSDYEAYMEEGAPLALTLPAEVYAMDGLGVNASKEKAAKSDAIRQFGQQVSRMIFTEIHKVPLDERELAFEATLEELEPGLFMRVINRAAKYVDKGMPSIEAAHAALASSVSEGFAKEILEAGRTGIIRPTGLLGLGTYGVGPKALDGFFSSLAKVVTTPAKAIGKGAAAVGKAIGKGVWSATKTVGKGVGGAVKFGVNVAKKVSQLGCKLTGSVAGQVAGAAVATASGAPPQVGVAGAKVASGICSKLWGGGSSPSGLVPVPPGGVPPGYVPGPGGYMIPAPGNVPWVPIAIGGAALLGVILLVK